MNTRLLSLLGCLLLTCVSAFADWKEVQAVQPGVAIMVNAGFITDAGTFVSATDESVTVKTRTGDVTVAKDEIDTVYIMRTGKQLTKRVFTYAVLAGGATAAVAFPVAAATMVRPNYVIPVAITLAGWSVGARVGRQSGRAKRIYNRK